MASKPGPQRAWLFVEIQRFVKVRILTFNTWGVPFFSKDRAARMRAIGRALTGMDVDVVGLQEVFYARDRQLIVRAAAEGGLVHHHYFHSGVAGSGLLTLSRYPIEETSYLRFQLNGRPQDLIRVDYYAGKGVGRARIATPAGPLDVYNAHFIAPYLEFGPDRFGPHRVAQALEAGRYMRATSGETPAVLTCDLNCYPDDLTYRTLVASGGLVESCGAVDAADGAIVDGAGSGGAVSDGAGSGGGRSGYATIHPPERFDYIFARSGSQGALDIAGSRFVLGGTPDPNPDGVLGYSDHYGILTEFELAPMVETAPAEAAEEPSLLAAIGDLLGLGIHANRRQRRKATLMAAAASVTSAALMHQRGARPAGSVTGVGAAALLALLLVAGGVNLSTAARLSTETNTLTTIFGQHLSPREASSPAGDSR
jgi:sphingomyelin phosphodiesterase 2